MTEESKYDILAIGNAIVDVLVKADDKFIKSLGLEKGTMKIIEKEKANKLFEFLSNVKEDDVNIKKMSGGSASNTAVAVRAFGGSAAFIGKICEDEWGARFKQKMAEREIHFPCNAVNSEEGSGRALIIVSKDGERTMCTYTGVSSSLSESDIDENLIKESKVIFITGYSWDAEKSKQSALRAMELAKKKQKKIAFALADFSCVRRHKEDFKKIIKEVDIVFANEPEIMALLDVKNYMDAVDQLAGNCKKNNSIIAITCGKEGAYVVTAEYNTHVATQKINDIVDTTGASALFAGAFIYAYTHEFDPLQAALLGNYAAAEGIKQFGARPYKKLKDLLVKI